MCVPDLAMGVGAPSSSMVTSSPVTVADDDGDEHLAGLIDHDHEVGQGGSRRAHRRRLP